MSKNTGPTEHVDPMEGGARLNRGRFDTGQATDEDLAAEFKKPHGRYDEGERTGADADTGRGRGRYDEGQASAEGLAAEIKKPHGRYDEGERTTPLPDTDEQQNVY